MGGMTISVSTLTDKDWYTNLDEHLKHYKEAKSDTLKKSAQEEAQVVLTEDIVAGYASDLLSGTPFFVRRLFRGKPITLVAHSEAGDTAYELDIYGRKWRKLETWNDDDNPIQIYASANVFVMCVKQVNLSSLGISKRVRFRVKNEDKKIVTYFTELNDLFDCEVLPLSKSLKPTVCGGLVEALAGSPSLSADRS